MLSAEPTHEITTRAESAEGNQCRVKRPSAENTGRKNWLGLFLRTAQAWEGEREIYEINQHADKSAPPIEMIIFGSLFFGVEKKNGMNGLRLPT